MVWRSYHRTMAKKSRRGLDLGTEPYEVRTRRKRGKPLELRTFRRRPAKRGGDDALGKLCR